MPLCVVVELDDVNLKSPDLFPWSPEKKKCADFLAGHVAFKKV